MLVLAEEFDPEVHLEEAVDLGRGTRHQRCDSPVEKRVVDTTEWILALRSVWWPVWPEELVC